MQAESPRISVNRTMSAAVQERMSRELPEGTGLCSGSFWLDSQWPPPLGVGGPGYMLLMIEYGKL